MESVAHTSSPSGSLLSSRGQGFPSPFHPSQPCRAPWQPVITALRQDPAAGRSPSSNRETAARLQGDSPGLRAVTGQLREITGPFISAARILSDSERNPHRVLSRFPLDAHFSLGWWPQNSTWHVAAELKSRYLLRAPQWEPQEPARLSALLSR